MGQDLQVVSHDGHTLPDNTSTVSGIDRLAQKFIMVLLTDSNSMPYITQPGCHFLKQLRTATHTEFGIGLAFSASLPAIRRSMHTGEAYIARDERFANAILHNMYISEGAVRLLFEVRNRTGEAAFIYTPELKLGDGYAERS